MEKIVLMLLTGTLLIGGLGAQTTPRPEIVVMDVGTTKAGLSTPILSTVDEKIREIFVKVGRFQVLGLNVRIDGASVQDLVDNLRQRKSDQAEMTKEVQMGEVFLTEAHLDSLLKSAWVIVPQLTEFSTVARSSGGSKVLLRASLAVVNGATLEIANVVNVESSGSASTENEAVHSALEGLPTKLEYEIRKVEAFQTRTTVALVEGDGTVVLDLGHGRGVQVGDLYTLGSGAGGLLRIAAVEQSRSVARIVLGTPRIGDPAREVAKLGVDWQGYTAVGLRASETSLLVGLKGVLSRGVDVLRPVLFLDTSPVAKGYAGLATIPVNLLLGVEWYSSWGAVEVKVGTALGGTGLVLPSRSGTPGDFSYLGAQVQGGLNFVMSQDWKVSVDAGARYLKSLSVIGNSLWGDHLLSFLGTGLSYQF